MKITRVAVVRGGPSAEYAVSMQSGAAVLEALRARGYEPRDIIVTRQGEWIEHGLVRAPEVHLSTADVVFIAMHGAYGEDGTVQRICERLHIPFTGSTAFASRVAFNKDLTKHTLADSGLALPRHIVVTQDDVSRLGTLVGEIQESSPDGLIIKPVMSGSSHGVRVVRSPADLIPVLTDALAEFEACMVEERIVGVEATAGVLEEFRSQRHYILPAIEIVPPATSDHFDVHVKYNGQTQEICPGRFSFGEKAALAEAAALVHTTLGLSHYSRSDFIVRNGVPYFLEVNTLPGLTAQSLFPKAAEAVGLRFADLIDHLVVTARVR